MQASDHAVLERRNLDSRGKFEELVLKCRKHEKDHMIQNASFDHAKFLFHNLLEMAAEKGEDVRIISGTFRDEFYNDLVGDVEYCLESGCKVRLIGLELDGHGACEKNQFIRAVQRHENGLVLFAGVSPDFRNISPPHFILVGNKRFRLEQDHHHGKAVANFNSEYMGSFLLELFQTSEKFLAA